MKINIIIIIITLSIFNYKYICCYGNYIYPDKCMQNLAAISVSRIKDGVKLHKFDGIKYHLDFILFQYSIYKKVVRHKEVCFNEIKIDVNGQLKHIFNDPNLHEQWYFLSTLVSISHELDKLWALNITGKGVNVAIIDGGVEENHRDLHQNCNKNLSYNFVSVTNEINASSQGLPTQSAGLISAVANNLQCGVGAAPSSKFSNLQIYDDSNQLFDDIRFTEAIVYKNDQIQIYVINYPVDFTMRYVQTNSKYFDESVEKSIKNGRCGLGNILIMGSGSKRNRGNNCGFNWVAQLKEVFLFGSISKYGKIPMYSEGCNAILAASLSSFTPVGEERFFSTTQHDTCENATGQSYASASISAGIIALLISHNPNLSIRQIMHLIVKTSIQYDHLSTINSAGFSYSSYLGFGLLNALRLIEYSDRNEVTALKPETVCSTYIFTFLYKIKKKQTQAFYIYTSGCYNSQFCVTRIEQVQIVLSIFSRKRNSIVVHLTSPSGTIFQILEPRYFDESRHGFNKWRLKLMGYFGEGAVGVWKLDIISTYRESKFKRIEFSFYGTCEDSTLNTIAHSKVQYYICSRAVHDNSEFIQKICYTPPGNNFNPKYGRDIYSFTGYEYQDIFKLKTLL